MTPEPSEDSILSKLIFVAIILVLVIVLAACALFIYNSLYPHTVAEPPVSITPTPVSTTVTAMPTTSPTKIATPTAVASPYVNIPQDTRVSITSGTYSDLGIWGDYIVYDETVSDNNINVHLYNIANKQDHVIARGNVHSYGTIGNGQVALLYPDTNVIKLYDIATGKTSQGSVNSNAARSSMVISGSYLLYCEDDGMMDPFTKTWDSVYCVYLFNMNDDTTSSIKSNIGKPIDIRMDGNYVVWTTLNPGGDGSNILLFNIQSKPLNVITIAQGGSNNHARISGNKVVYHSDTSGTHHIYIYDISTGQTVPLTNDSKQMSADIYGNTVVFDDYRDGNWNIYTYDLTTHLSHYFTFENHDQMSPVIYGKHVAYMDYRNTGLGVGESDIYTMDLP